MNYIISFFMVITVLFAFPQGVSAASEESTEPTKSQATLTPTQEPSPTCGEPCTEAPTTQPTITPQITNTQGSASATPTITQVPTVTPIPTITVDPTIMQMRQDLNNGVKHQADAVKAQVKQQQEAISSFIRSRVDSLHSFFDSLFN